MASTKFYMNELFWTVLVLSTLLSTASAVDCQGKSFHCVNSTHFMICVDLGGGVSQSIDNFFIACPPPTVCQGTNHFECEFPAPTTPSTTLSNVISETTPPWVEVVTVTVPPGNTTKEFSEKYMNTDTITTIIEDSFTTAATVDFTTENTSDSYINNELNMTKTLPNITGENLTTATETVTQPAIRNTHLVETETVTVVEELMTTVLETTTQSIASNTNIIRSTPIVAEGVSFTSTTYIENVTRPTIKNRNATETLAVVAEDLRTTPTEYLTPPTIEIKKATEIIPDAAEVTKSFMEAVTQSTIENMNVSEIIIGAEKLTTTFIEAVTQSIIENTNASEIIPIVVEEITGNFTETATHTTVNMNLTEIEPVLAVKEIITPSIETVTPPIIENNASEIIPIGAEKPTTTFIEAVTQSTIKNMNVSKTIPTVVEKITTKLSETATNTAVNKNLTETEPVVAVEGITTPSMETVTPPIIENNASEIIPIGAEKPTTFIEAVTQSTIKNMNVSKTIPTVVEEITTKLPETATNTAVNKNLTKTDPVVAVEVITTPSMETVTPPIIENNASEIIPIGAEKPTTTFIEAVTHSTIKNMNVSKTILTAAEEITTILPETATNTAVNKNLTETEPAVAVEGITTPSMETVTPPIIENNASEIIPVGAEKLTTTFIEAVTQSTIKNMNVSKTIPTVVEEITTKLPETATNTAVNKNLTKTDPVVAVEVITTPSMETVTPPIIVNNGSEIIPIAADKLTTTLIETVTQPTIESVNASEIIPDVAEEITTTITETVTHTTAKKRNLTETEPVVTVEEITTPFIETVTPSIIENINATEFLPDFTEERTTFSIETVTQPTVQTMNSTETISVVAEEITTITETATQTTVENNNLSETERVAAAEEIIITSIETVTHPTIRNTQASDTIPVVGEEIATTVTEIAAYPIVENKNITESVDQITQPVVVETVTEPTTENMHLSETMSIVSEKKSATRETATYATVKNKTFTEIESVITAEKVITTSVEMVTQPTIKNKNVTETKVVADVKTAATLIGTAFENRDLTEPVNQSTEPVVVAEEQKATSIETVTQPTIMVITEQITTSTTNTEPEYIATTAIEQVTPGNLLELETINLYAELPQAIFLSQKQNITNNSLLKEPSAENITFGAKHKPTSKTFDDAVHVTTPDAIFEHVMLVDSTTTDSLVAIPSSGIKEPKPMIVVDSIDFTTAPTLDIATTIDKRVVKTSTENPTSSKFDETFSEVTNDISITNMPPLFVHDTNTNLLNNIQDQVHAVNISEKPIQTVHENMTEINVINEITKIPDPADTMLLDGELTNRTVYVENSATTGKPTTIVYDERLTTDTTPNFATMETTIPTSQSLDIITTESVYITVSIDQPIPPTLFDDNLRTQAALPAKNNESKTNGAAGTHDSMAATSNFNQQTAPKIPENNFMTNIEPQTIGISTDTYAVPPINAVETSFDQAKTMETVNGDLITIDTAPSATADQPTDTTMDSDKNKNYIISKQVNDSLLLIQTTQKGNNDDALGTTVNSIGVSSLSDNLEINGVLKNKIEGNSVSQPEYLPTQLEISVSRNPTILKTDTYATGETMLSLPTMVPIKPNNEDTVKVNDVQNIYKSIQNVINIPSESTTTAVGETGNKLVELSSTISENNNVTPTVKPILPFIRDDNMNSLSNNQPSQSKLTTQVFSETKGLEIATENNKINKHNVAVVSKPVVLPINNIRFSTPINNIPPPSTDFSSNRQSVNTVIVTESYKSITQNPTYANTHNEAAEDASSLATGHIFEGSILNIQNGFADRTSDVHKVGDLNFNSKSERTDEVSDIITVPIVGGSSFNSQNGVSDKASDITSVHINGGPTLSTKSEISDKVNGVAKVPTVGDPSFNSQTGVTIGVTKVYTVGGPTFNSQLGVTDRASDITLGKTVGGDTSISRLQESTPNIPQNNSQNFKRVSQKTNLTAVSDLKFVSQNTSFNVKTALHNLTRIVNMQRKLSQNNNSYANTSVSGHTQTQKTNKSYTTARTPIKSVTPNQNTRVANFAKQIPNNKTPNFTCVHGIRGRYSDKDHCRKFYICVGNNQPIVGYCPENTVFSDLKKLCTKNMSHCIRNNEFKCPSAGRFSDFMKDNVYYICVSHKNHLYRFKFQCQRSYILDKSTVKCIETQEIESNESVSTSSSYGSGQTGSSGTTNNSSSSSTTHSNDDSSSGNTDNSNSKSNKSLNSEKSKENPKKREEREETEEKEENDEKDEVFKCKKEGKFPVRDDCRRYYLCKKNGKSEYRRKIKKCESGDVFHKSKKKCVDNDSYEC